MLGKLMKYEFKSTARIFLPLYGALIMVSILNCVFTNLGLRTPLFIGGGVSVMMCVAIGVVTFILTLQRFNKNLLGNEGYLMFTLPVKTDSLIISKLLVATVWFIASLGVVMVAILIMTMGEFDIRDVLNDIVKAFTMIRIDSIHVVLYVIEIVLICIFWLFGAILFVYTCLALSLLANKRRLLTAFAAFVAICIFGQIFAVILINAAGAIDIGGWVHEMSEVALSHIVALLLLLAEIVVCAAFYFVTRYMLKRRLNLE